MEFTEAKLTIGYWAIRGLGAPLRMAAMYKGVKVNCISYDLKENETKDGFDSSAWFKNDKPALKEQNVLINLPYIIDNGTVITQSHACLMYLGRQLDLLGTNPMSEWKCEQLLCEYMDLRNNVVDLAYPAGGNIAHFLEKQVNAANGSMHKLNLWLELKYSSAEASPSSIFFVDDSASVVDFAIWEILDQCVAMATFVGLPNPFEGKLPFLAAFHASFAQLPGNARYLASPLHRLPSNGVSAKTFGATPSGAAWEPGVTENTWSGSSGIY